MKSPKIHRTPLYRAKAAYSNMRRRCRNRCGTEPAYANVELRMTRKEWLKWAVPRYEKFQEWHPHRIPNVSRRDDRGHYEPKNLRIVSSRRNRREQRNPFSLENERKICSRCLKTKRENSFNKRTSSSDGLDHWCRRCKAKQRSMRH